MFSLFVSLCFSTFPFEYKLHNNEIELIKYNDTSSQTSIKIPQTIKNQNKDYPVTILGERLFIDSSIENIELHSKITQIKSEAFKNCKNLKTINMKSLKLQVIEDSTFESCTNLVAVILPTTLITIGNRAFYNCLNLEAIDMENVPIVKICNYSFTNCRKITSIKLPMKTLQEIGEYSFANTSISSLLLPEKVRCLGNGAFSHTIINELDISDSLLTVIPDHAFEYCKISTLLLPPSTVALGISSFEGNENLIKVDLSYTSVVSINNSAFKRCKNLCAIVFSITTDILGDSVFEETGFTNFTISESIHHIGEGLFKNCPKLTVVGFYELQYDKIPHYTFYNCTELSEIHYPRRSFYIQTHAFEYTGFKHIRFANSAIGIDDWAFAHCHKVLTIDISNIEYSINGSHLFEDCPLVETIMFAEDDIVLPPYLIAGCVIEKLELPPNILGIGEGCFMNCKKLKTVDLLRTSIKEISDYAFYGCNIQKILLPPSVSVIGYMSLGNNSIDSVVYYGETLPFFGYTTTFKSVVVNFMYPSDIFCGQKVERIKLRMVGQNGEELPEEGSTLSLLLNFISMISLIAVGFYVFRKYSIDRFFGIDNRENNRLVIG